jgi:hypothetical protein
MLYYRTTDQSKESKGQAVPQAAPQKDNNGIAPVIWDNSRGREPGADSIRETKAKQKDKDQEPRYIRGF